MNEQQYNSSNIQNIIDNFPDFQCDGFLLASILTPILTKSYPHIQKKPQKKKKKEKLRKQVSYCFLIQLYWMMGQQLYQIEMYLKGIKNQDILPQDFEINPSFLSSFRAGREDPRSPFLNNKSGHWNEKEQAKYYAFLDKFKEKFSKKESRRQWKVFKLMSQFLKTRDPNQCRSHHHKMTRSFKSISDTLAFLRKKNPNLLAKSEKYADQLMKINDRARKDELFPQPLEHIDQEGPLKEEQNKQVHNYGNYFDRTKLNDIGNLRTDVSCNILSEQPIIDFSGDAFAPPQNSYKGFPTTGLLNTSLTTVNQFVPNYIENKDFQYDPYLMNYPYMQGGPTPLQSQQKWLECHECFIKWLTKLHSLIQ